MRRSRLHLPLAASCIVLGAFPLRAVKADAPRAASTPLASLVMRLDASFDPPPVVAVSPRIHAFDTPDFHYIALRLEHDYTQQRVTPDRTAAAGRVTPIHTAVVEASRTVKVLAGGTLTYDSNVLRLPANVDPLTAVGVSSKSDVISTAYVGLSIDKAYAQQRIEGEVTETAYRYANLAALNYAAFEYRGAWHWRITPRWGGTLQAERRVAAASFADSQFSQRIQRNLRTTDNYRFSLDGALFGGWHALFGAYQNQLKYDQGFAPQNSSRTQGVEAGIKYERASGSAVTVMQRSIQGEYLNRVPDAANVNDNAFRQHDTELKLDWNVSGKSVMRGRLTWIDVRHANFAARDFSGLAGEWGYVWSPTGKVRVDLTAKRDIAPWWQASSSYRIDDSLSLTPTWQAGAKTAVRARWERTQSDFRGPVVPQTDALRRDTVQNVQLGMDWNPLRNLVLDASVQRQWRASNTAGVDFDARIAQFNAKFKF